MLSHLLKSNVKSKTPLFNVTGEVLYKRVYVPFLELLYAFDCKFGFLSTEDYLRCFEGTYSRKIELTFKFILKSCCHSMFSNINPISISKFYFDGHDHLGTDFDANYLSTISLRDYCKISKPIEIDSRHIKERDDETLLIMNLVDNAVSSFTACISSSYDPYCTLKPFNDILSRVKKGLIFKNKNSEWYKTLSFSKVNVVNGSINFSDLFENKDQLVFDFY